MPGGIEKTPTDKLTGLPLPIFVTRRKFYSHSVNYHHHFHPKRSSALGVFEEVEHLDEDQYQHPQTQEMYIDPLKLEGKAVRFSRGQLVPVFLHDRYHDIFYGPPLPQDRKSKFTVTVLACAGVMPRKAIDLSIPEEYSEKGLNDDQHRFIASSKRMYFEHAMAPKEGDAEVKRDWIGKFFAAYAVEQSLRLPTEMFEEFLHTKKEQKRRKLGREILNEAIGLSVAELVPIREKARHEGMVHSKATSLGSTILKFFPESKFPEYYSTLENQ